MSEAVQPVGRMFVRIVCNNPDCKRKFNAEVNDGECLARCPRCRKEFYVRVEGVKVYVRSINGRI